MANNESMVKAKKVKNDEFYTVYECIQKEINAYLEYNPDTFRGKTILLPCDDPEWSNFTRYFAQNFETLGLKKLISTSYATDSKNNYSNGYQFRIEDFLTDFETQSPKYDKEKTASKGKIFILEKDVNGNGKIDIEDLEWSYLKGDGDFRSEEVTKLRDEADMIITNPPFSLFVDFMEWIAEADKTFLVIGNQGNITYKDIFIRIKNNELWIGATSNSEDMVFRVPEGADVKISDKEKAEKLGYKGNYTRMGNTCWFTNIDHGRRHQPLQLMTMEDNIKYSRHKDIKGIGYVKYDNYDAIEVKYVDSIPSDYDGMMGVASSFLEKYCPDQFEIVGATQTGCHSDDMVKATYKDYVGYHQDGTLTGRKGNTCGHNPMIEKNDGVHDYYMNADGKIVQSANGRILIRRKGCTDESNTNN